MHLRLNTLHLELLRWLLENDRPLDHWALNIYATKNRRFEDVELIVSTFGQARKYKNDELNSGSYN